MSETIDLELLNVFAALAEARSFTGAAKRLRTTKATVSRSLARLEEKLGTELVHRTTRTLSLSTAGTALYERIAPHVAVLRDASHELPGEEEQPHGELRITAPVDLGNAILPEVLSRFALRYPGVRVHAELTNTIVDLVAEGYDLALRLGQGPMKDSSLTARRLAAIHMGAFASPAYVARRGAPRGVDDDDHELLLHPGSRHAPPFKKHRVRPRLTSNDMFLLRDVARQGGGIAVLPTFLAAPLVASGDLVRVLASQVNVTSAQLMLVYPSSGQVARKVEAFRDVVIETLKARPLPV
jgi:DNA-binding transcriptional LysR family regulator